MPYPDCNRRSTSRTLLLLPVFIALGYGEHRGVVRDVSASGIFLYSDFTPPLGAEIELKLRPRRLNEQQEPMSYSGLVSRVTSGVTGAPVGIALTVRTASAATALQGAAAFRQLTQAAACGRTLPPRFATLDQDDGVGVVNQAEKNVVHGAHRRG